MMPLLYTIGPFNVYAFGFFLALSFILSTFVVWKLSREEYKEEEYLDVYFYTSLVSLVVGRAVYIIRNWGDFGFNFLKYILVVETPGLSLIGGGIGGFVFLYFFTGRRKIKYFHYLDILAPAFALALSFIRIGQQLGGAAYGAETDFFLKVRIAGRSGFYHPVELYEALMYFILFIFLWVLYKRNIKRKWKEGILFSIFAVYLGLSVAGLEFLKTHHVYLYNLSFRQILALMITGGGVLLFMIRVEIFRKLLNYFKKGKA